MTGRTKLHRKIQDNSISSNLELLGLFSYFLTKANHSYNILYISNTKIEIKPWQFVWSVRWISERFGISIWKTQRLLKILEEEKIVIHKWYTKYSLFTIVNRHRYQSSDTQIDTQIDTQTIHRQVTNKNDKNDKNDKEDNYFSEFRKAYPNKKAKENAMRLFGKRIKSWVDPNAIIAWAIKYSVTTIWLEKRYVKHPSTWLNGWCRNDDQDVDYLRLYTEYKADTREIEDKRVDYCKRYTEPIMLQAQKEYQTKQRQSFIL